MLSTSMRMGRKRSRSASKSGSLFDFLRLSDNTVMSVTESAEVAYEAIHETEIRVMMKGKVKVRWMSLSADFLRISRKTMDDSVMIGCDQVESAAATEVKNKVFWFEVHLKAGAPLLCGTGTKNATTKWIRHLNACKLNYELKKWTLDPAAVTLTKSVGSGACGKVWRAELCGSPVAVKEMYASSDFDLVKQEILVLSKLRNPYCVRLLGMYEVEKKLYIVTEYVEGGSLDEYLYSKVTVISTLAKLMILRDLARGIAYLHSHGILHRDIKSDNCLIHSLSPEAQQLASIADFGVSKEALQPDEVVDLEQTTALGTPIYMAPEIFSSNYTAAVDVWSFAMLMCELITEKRPWDKVTGGKSGLTSKILEMIDEGERPELPEASFFGIPSDMVTLISDCWLLDPTLRPEMPEVLDRLTTIVHTTKTDLQAKEARINLLAMEAPNRPAPAPPPSEAAGKYADYSYVNSSDASVAFKAASSASIVLVVQALQSFLQKHPGAGAASVSAMLTKSFTLDDSNATCLTGLLVDLGKSDAVTAEAVVRFTQYFCGPKQDPDCSILEVCTLVRKPYFFSTISGGRADAVLKEHAAEGAFLLRISGSSPGSLALSVFTDGVVKHWRVPFLSGLKVVVKGEVFPSIAECIRHFETASLSGSGEVDVFLKEPCPRRG